jgi:hypothetical protein
MQAPHSMVVPVHGSGTLRQRLPEPDPHTIEAGVQVALSSSALESALSANVPESALAASAATGR